MEAVLSLVATVMAAAVSSGAVTALVQRALGRADRRDALCVGVRLLLEERIEGLCLATIRQGSVSYARLKYLRAAHGCYHDGLGGNGDLDALMHRVEALPVGEE